MALRVWQHLTLGRGNMQICVLHTGLDDSVNWFSEIKTVSQHLTVIHHGHECNLSWSGH